MHLLQRALLVICALIHGIAKKQLIFDQVGFKFLKVGDALPKFMDTNCDGMVDYAEALSGTAKILRRDPVQLQREWEQMGLESKSHGPPCARHGPNSSFFVFALSAVYMHLGRIDQRPCRMTQTLVNVGYTYGFNSENYMNGALTSVQIWRFFKHFHSIVTGREGSLFQNKLDLNADGCLSEDEWKSFMQSRKKEVEEGNYSGFRARTLTEFSTIEDYRPPRDFGFGTVIQPFYAESCVTKFRFAAWNLFSLLTIFEKANQTSPCYKEVNQSNVPLEQPEQLKVELSDQQQGSMESTIILVGIFGGSGIACLGICIIWCRCKHRHKDDLDLRKKHVFMETEIEAWSTFDRTLIARTSSLKPSFVQILGLGNFKEDQLSLIQSAHPEDHAILHVTLTQLNSEPITLDLRFQYGISRVLTGEAVFLQDDIKYISVQTTLVLGSESNIHVGLKSLSGNGQCNSEILDPAVLGDQKPQMPDEEWGNDQTQDTSGVVTEMVFNTADLQQIANLGLEEHWVICNESITWKNVTMESGGFGKVRRGLLFGSADVAVKMALTDEREERFASKCKLLANEVRLFRRIRHPNVVLFHGVIFTSGPDAGDKLQLGIVLEWVNGGNLDQHYKARHMTGAYDPVKLKGNEGQLMLMCDCCLLLDVARGMLYLHALRPIILHRDLKPANVLVDRVCAPPRAKLTDFGLSIMMEPEGHVRKKAGTQAYMAPEVRSGQSYNSMVDVFSFGCLIVFAFTGKHPRKDVDSLVLAPGFCEFVESHSSDPGYSTIKRWLDSFVSATRQCLKPNPTMRPAFADLFTLLSNALHDPGLQSEIL